MRTILFLLYWMIVGTWYYVSSKFKSSIVINKLIDVQTYRSPPVDVLHMLQDDRNGVYVNRICHDTIVTL